MPVFVSVCMCMLVRVCEWAANVNHAINSIYRAENGRIGGGGGDVLTGS